MRASAKNIFQVALVTVAVMFALNMLKPRSRILTRLVNSSDGTAQRSGPTVLDQLGLDFSTAGIFT